MDLLTNRNSGKSCLLKYLVSAKLHKYKKVFVVCPTEKLIGTIEILLMINL